jgi:hypothetical protein
MNPSDGIPVFSIDDHPLLREGITVFAHKKIRGHESVPGQVIGLRSRWRDQDQLVLHERLSSNPASTFWALDEADRYLVVEEKLYDLARVAAT